MKAVFFDLYHTLVRYEPPREEIQAGVLNDAGIEVRPEVLSWPLVAADEFIYQELAKVPMGQRSETDKMTLWVEYEKVLLREAGIEIDEQQVLELLGKMQQVKMKLVLFDDVVPALTDLSRRGLILGLISNIDRDISPLLNELGLPPRLQVVVTSLDTGFTKPHPQIFGEALNRAGVPAEEAMYVGDQYQVDVLGARDAGMVGVLLDRGGYFPEITDCPRISSLIELSEML